MESKGGLEIVMSGLSSEEGFEINKVWINWQLNKVLTILWTEQNFEKWMDIFALSLLAGRNGAEA